MKSLNHISSVPALSAALCALLASLAPVGRARAEEPYVVWAKTSPWGIGFGGMAFTPQGEMLVLTGWDWLLKFDAQGRVVSSNLVSSLPGQMTSTAGIATDSTGATFLFGLGGPDGGNAFSVVKLNVSGELAWVSRASTPLSGSPNSAVALAPDAQGNLWVGGVSEGPFTLGSYAFGEGHGPLLCKLDRDGQVLWAMRIDFQPTSGGPDIVVFYDLVVDAVGNVLISGWLAAGTADFGGTTVYPQTHLDLWGQVDRWGQGFIAKYSASGSLLWVRMSELPGFGQGSSLAVDRHGNTYFVGSDDWFGKLNGNGELVWVKEFPGTYQSTRRGIAMDSTDQPVFTGEISGTVHFDDIVLISKATDWQDFFVAKADASGNIQWAMRGGGSTSARGYNVLCDKLGNVFLGADILSTVAHFDGITLNPRPVRDGYPTLVLAKISPTPPLKIAAATSTVTMSWPAKATNYVLEAATTLPAISWNPVTNNPTVGPTERSVQLPIGGGAKFFRLRRP